MVHFFQLGWYIHLAADVVFRLGVLPSLLFLVLAQLYFSAGDGEGFAVAVLVEFVVLAVYFAFSFTPVDYSGTAIFIPLTGLRLLRNQKVLTAESPWFQYFVFQAHFSHLLLGYPDSQNIGADSSRHDRYPFNTLRSSLEHSKAETNFCAPENSVFLALRNFKFLVNLLRIEFLRGCSSNALSHRMHLTTVPLTHAFIDRELSNQGILLLHVFGTFEFIGIFCKPHDSVLRHC